MRLREFVYNLASGTTIRIIPMVHKIMSCSQYIGDDEFMHDIIYCDIGTQPTPMDTVLMDLYMECEVLEVCAGDPNNDDVFLTVKITVPVETLITFLLNRTCELYDEKLKLTETLVHCNFILHDIDSKLCVIEGNLRASRQESDQFIANVRSYLRIDDHPIDTDHSH